MRRVVWSKHAHNDFGGILDYIAEDNPAAAQRVADRIDQTIQTLAATPTGRKGRVSGTYEKVVRRLPYIVAYALGDEPKGHEPSRSCALFTARATDARKAGRGNQTRHPSHDPPASPSTVRTTRDPMPLVVAVPRQKSIRWVSG